MDHKPTSIEITKASGEKSFFIPQKLLHSLLKSGADYNEAQHIVETISKDLYPGISTKKIYHKAFHLLKRSARHLAARYNLKNAIMQLGPSGYPFEKYVGEILKCQGYSVQVGNIIAGKCVNHEIDVIAEKGSHQFMVECKYHNLRGNVCDVKIPLYIHSRFQDIEEQWAKLPGKGTKFHQGWVVTNTRFTQDAIDYGTCAGLNLIGWNFPAKGSLKELIDSFGLYPITCLTSITAIEKKYLLEKGVILSSEIQSNQNLLLEAGIKQPRLQTILEESNSLCGSPVKHEKNFINENHLM